MEYVAHLANCLAPMFVYDLKANDTRTSEKITRISEIERTHLASDATRPSPVNGVGGGRCVGRAAMLYGVHPAAHTQTQRRTRSRCGLCEHLLVARTAWRRSLSQRCHGSAGARLGVGCSLASGSITAVKLAPTRPLCWSSLSIAGCL